MLAARWFWLGCLLPVVGCSEEAGLDRSSKGPVENAEECREIGQRPNCLVEAAAGCLSGPPSLTMTQAVTERPAVRIGPPYGNTDCPGRALIDIAAELAPASGVWLHGLWDSTQFDEGAACDQAVVTVGVWREGLDGQWREWDDYRTIGFWRDDACRTVLCGGGKLPQGGLNRHTEFPWSWVTVEGALRIRVSVAAHGGACEPKDILFAAADQP